jgi:ADP-heptose:LPS heptosyltransferase
LDFLTQVQLRSFDLAIQLHGNGTTFNPVMVLMGARYNAGQYLPGYYCPDPDRFLPYQERESEVGACLRVVERLGFPAQGEALEFPLRKQDFSELAGLPESRLLEPGRFACLHPGASTPDRCWPVERFAMVGDALAARGLRVVLTGLEREAPLTAQVARAMSTLPINLTGRLSLGGMAALLKNAGLLVCNDTGVSHLADALGTRSVVIFSHSDPQKWAPLNRQLHRVIASPATTEAIKPGEGFSIVPASLAFEQVMWEVNDLLQQDFLLTA